jgi:hypothetical protein
MVSSTDRTTSMDITRRRELASRLLDGYVHGPAAATEATARALAKAPAAKAIVLVEGISDQTAAGTLLQSAWWSCLPAARTRSRAT